jgi:hypothetical protein
MEGQAMRDPVERMQAFVEEQKRQVIFEHARILWSRRLPHLLPGLRAVVETFHQGLCEPSSALVSILSDPSRGEFPLVIAFERRSLDVEGILRLHRTPTETEAGASCLFRAESDGIVYGYRYPFHSVRRDVRPERFVDLGEPDRVHADALGNAVVDFLEWAAVGDGCGSRKLRFWSPPESLATSPPTIELRVVAA